MGDDDNVTSELGDLPEAKTDDIDRAPGGADATVLESDTGASVITADPDTDLLDDNVGDDDSTGKPVTPDQPLSAQQEEEKVPDAIQEPEQPESEEQETDNTDGEQAPSG
jgi:hypothetical protein